MPLNGIRQSFWAPFVTTCKMLVSPGLLGPASAKCLAGRISNPEHDSALKPEARSSGQRCSAELWLATPVGCNGVQEPGSPPSPRAPAPRLPAAWQGLSRGSCSEKQVSRSHMLEGVSPQRQTLTLREGLGFFQKRNNCKSQDQFSSITTAKQVSHCQNKIPRFTIADIGFERLVLNCSLQRKSFVPELKMWRQLNNIQNWMLPVPSTRKPVFSIVFLWIIIIFSFVSWRKSPHVCIWQSVSLVASLNPPANFSPLWQRNWAFGDRKSDKTRWLNKDVPNLEAGWSTKATHGRHQASAFELCRSPGCLRHQINSTRLDPEAQTSQDLSIGGGVHCNSLGFARRKAPISCHTKHEI